MVELIHLLDRFRERIPDRIVRDEPRNHGVRGIGAVTLRHKFFVSVAETDDSVKGSIIMYVCI